MGLFSNELKLWITMEDALSDLELIENGILNFQDDKWVFENVQGTLDITLKK